MNDGFIRKERPATPKEQAYERLKEWIIYSEFKPGTVLSERELAECLGISRTPLREILQRLQYQRLIVIRPRKGIFVAPIDFFTLRDIFETRLPLERSVAVLATQRINAGQMEALEGLVAAMREAQAAGDLKRQIRLDQSFHETLAEAAGNHVLAEMLEDLHNVCLRFWHLSREAQESHYGGIEELEQVTASMRRGDARESARLYAEHVLSFLDIFDSYTSNLLRRLPFIG